MYSVTHMAMDNSDSEIENPLPPHGLLFPNSSNVVVLFLFFIFTSSHRQDKTSRRALGGDRKEFLLNVFLSATYIFLNMM